MALHDTHRPLEVYFAALHNADFVIERVLEPKPDEAYVAAFPEIKRWLERPGFLHVRASLAAAA